MIRTIHSRTNQYNYNSFLPAIIRDWNDLPCSDRILDTVDDFKRQLRQGIVIVPKYFYVGNRSMQILHTRLRIGCSSLNYDLYSKNIIEFPLCNCRCGDIENADHLYRNHRQVFMDTLSQHGNITLNIILNGDLNLPNEANIAIFEAVQILKKVNRLHSYQSLFVPD